MKKLKIEFWYGFFYLGSCLHHLGDWMEGKGIDKLENQIRDDPTSYQNLKKKRKGPVTRAFPFYIVIVVCIFSAIPAS